MSTLVFLKFTATQYKTAARIFNTRIAPDDPLGDEMQKDGWYQPAADGPFYYYNFDVLGPVRSTNRTGGTDAAPTYTMRTGVHVNLLWGGPEETVPAQLAPYRVTPVHPAVVFG
jgi:hypothetical protein